MSNLNSQQKAVIDWILHGKGSLNLVARAGCGKTFTLIRGALRTIVEHDLGEVAIMAFNKSAGDEFKARIKALADETDDQRFLEWKRVNAGTVHSFGFSAVRRWAKGVQVNDKKVWDILEAFAEAEGRAKILRMQGHDRGWEVYRDRSIYHTERSSISKLVSLAKQSAAGFLFSIDDQNKWFSLADHHGLEDDLEGEVAMEDVVKAAIRTLKRSIEQDREVIDFDDMILVPLVHNLRLWGKDWVLIDEAQDTNPARRALALKLLKPRTGRLIAVGDDRQAIYGFTGADSDAMEIIKSELNSAELPLTVTYRCPKAVVAEANRLVPDLQAHESAPEGKVRTLAEVREEKSGDETRAVAWYEDETPAATSAILCRNTKPLIETAYGLLAKGIGCRVEGREIGEGLVKLATRWKRIKTLSALADKLEDYKEREIQKWNAKGREEKAQGIEDKVDALFAIINPLREEGKNDVDALVLWIRGLFGDSKPGQVSNVTTLSTIHKAKGREWKVVYFLRRATTLPSKYARKPWQLHQEANLEYVGETRAMEELVFVD